MSEEKREHLTLYPRDQSVKIFGDLVMDDNSCHVEGIACGLNSYNYMSFTPDELEGTSSERGQIWIERVFNMRRTVASGQRPAPVAFE